MFFLDFQEKYLFLKRNYESKKKKISEFIFHLNEHFIYIQAIPLEGMVFLFFIQLSDFQYYIILFICFFHFCFFPKINVPFYWLS